MSRSSLAAATPAPEPATPSLDGNASTGATPDQPGTDRRAHKRHTVAEVPFVTKVRLKYGPAVALIDLSAGGAQIETTNFRLQPGSTVVVEISGSEAELSIPAQVLRCQLASLLPEPIYRGALVFKRPLDLAALAPAEAHDDPAAELNPMLEHARLRQTLTRLALPDTAASDTALRPLFNALNAALATLDTPAGRRAGANLSGEVAALFHAVTVALGNGPSAGALVGAIEEHLRHIVPARAIRLVDPEGFMQLQGSEAILLSVPCLRPETPADRVAVEFPDGCEPGEMHMQLLKAGVQLLAVARELGRLAGSDTALTLQTEQKLPPGWSRIVIRYNDGKMHKGFTQNFLPTRGFVHVLPEPVASPDGRLAVPFTDLKAIFFVKDHEGNAGYDEAKAPDPSARGRQVSVTFKDGEHLTGTTVNYSSTGPGFIVQPADPKSNNDRVFVIRDAVRTIKFLK